MDNLILTRNLRDKNFKAYLISYSFPDGIASEHNNFSVSNFKELNSETFAFTNLTAKTSCTYTYEITEILHECYSGEHSGISEQHRCKGTGSQLPYSTFAIAVLFDNCGAGGGGSSPGNEHNPGDIGSGPGNEYTPGGGGTPGSGGGSPVDTGMSFPPPCQTSDCDVKLLANDINDMLGNTLNYEQLSFLFENNDVAVTIENYLDQNNNTAGKTFSVWAINYLIQNPTVTINQFKNWFMGTSEGQDGDYDAEYWYDPNLTFPQQELPTWAKFDAAFPRDSDPLYNTPEKMFNSIGGDVAAFYSGPKTNTCAIRLSKALNYSDVVIPKIDGQTYKGKDNKYYFKSAYQINIWMRKTFGTNPATSTTPYNENHKQYTQNEAGEHGVNLPSLLKGKKGIYSIFSSNFKWATGHADLLNDDATCGNACHFYDAPIQRLDIWILN